MSTKTISLDSYLNIVLNDIILGDMHQHLSYYIMLVQFLVILIYSKVPVHCTDEGNALIGELFILTKDVGDISCVTGIDKFLRILFHL